MKATRTNASGNGSVSVTAGSTTVAGRGNVNFVGSNGVNVTLSDDLANNRVNVTVAGLSLSGYATTGAVSGLASALTSHADSSTAHGVTGAVVGTDSTQTLKNKTLSGLFNTITEITDACLSPGINAAKIGDGSVSNEEFQRLNGVTANVQTQLDAKLALAGGTLTGSLSGTSAYFSDSVIAQRLAAGVTGNFGPFPYETGIIQSAGDTKLGVYTTNSGGAAAVTLGNRGVIYGGMYPGFEFQHVAGSTDGANYVRYNFIRRDFDVGTVNAAQADLFRIYGDKRVLTSNNTLDNGAGGATFAGTVQAQHVVITGTGSYGLYVTGGVVQAAYLNGDGTGITNLNANNLASGTIPVARLPGGIDAAKIGAGTVSNAEFGHLDGVTGNVQQQIDAKATLPSQAGQAGKVLKTDGTNLSWATPDVTSSPNLATVLAQGNNAGGAGIANLATLAVTGSANIGPYHSNAVGRFGVSGPTGEFSFMSRNQSAFIDTPTNGERWVLYSTANTFRVWSGTDKVTVDSTGTVTATAFAGGTVTAANVAVDGRLKLRDDDSIYGDWSVWMDAEDGNDELRFDHDAFGNMFRLNPVEGTLQIPLAVNASYFVGNGAGLTNLPAPTIADLGGYVVDWPDWENVYTHSGTLASQLQQLEAIGQSAMSMASAAYSWVGERVPMVSGSEPNSVPTWVGDFTGLQDPHVLYVVDGKVGVGTATPGAHLSVVGAVSANQVGQHIYNSIATGYSALRVGTDTITAAGMAIHHFNGSWITGVGSEAYVANGTNISGFGTGGLTISASAGPLAVYVGGTAAANERMRVTTDGNVGIGTMTPAAKLDVSGTVRATSVTLTGTGSSGLLVADGTVISKYLVVSGGTATLPGGMTVESFGGGSWLNLPTGGPSGIGTGGAGNNPFVAYVAGNGQWFNNALPGDVAYRNTSGRILFGTGSGNAGVVLASNSLTLTNNLTVPSVEFTGASAGLYANGGTGLILRGPIWEARNLYVNGVITATTGINSAYGYFAMDYESARLPSLKLDQSLAYDMRSLVTKAFNASASDPNTVVYDFDLGYSNTGWLEATVTAVDIATHRVSYSRVRWLVVRTPGGTSFHQIGTPENADPSGWGTYLWTTHNGMTMQVYFSQPGYGNVRLNVKIEHHFGYDGFLPSGYGYGGGGYGGYGY